MYFSGLSCVCWNTMRGEKKNLFSSQVFTILDCYKKAAAQAQRGLPHQIIAVGTRWNKHITPLIKEFMNDPHIVITVVEEAALFGNVEQVKLWKRCHCWDTWLVLVYWKQVVLQCSLAV